MTPSSPRSAEPTTAARCRRFLPRALVLMLGGLSACATAPDEPEGPPRAEVVWAITEGNELIKFNAGQPRRILERRPVAGLQPGEHVLGADFRVARGVLFALTYSGRVLTLQTASGQTTAVGAAPASSLPPGRYGVDFNPAADRIRVVHESGLNLRLHPDTGALLATDPPLAYAPNDPAAGRTPRVAGAAYTYNKRDEKLTTNFAIDLATGHLVRQGSAEGAQPVVSPNTGQLFTVGPLGTGPLDDVAFDIADLNNAALVAARQGPRTRLHLVDLATGRATLLGTVGDGRALRALAIEP